MCTQIAIEVPIYWVYHRSQIIYIYLLKQLAGIIPRKIISQFCLFEMIIN